MLYHSLAVTIKNVSRHWKQLHNLWAHGKTKMRDPLFKKQEEKVSFKILKYKDIFLVFSGLFSLAPTLALVPTFSLQLVVTFPGECGC